MCMPVENLLGNLSREYYCKVDIVLLVVTLTRGNIYE